MNGMNYLFQTNLYLILFIGFYALVLRNETFFRQNRFYLNTSIFLSFVIPFINSDWFRDLFITQKVREAAIVPSQMIYETIIVGADDETAWTVAELVFLVYATVAALLLVRFLIRLALLSSKLKVEKGSAFSFFNNMVVDTTLPEAGTIIDHEKVHMRQWHSADIIFIELVAIINWFNPVMYLYKKEIRHIHEFIADEEAATLMQSKSDYALLLFSNTLGINPHELRNNFFNKSLLKRRIMMLHKTKSRKTGLWKYGFSAPLFALMLIVSAATAGSENNALNINSENDIPLLGAISTTEKNKPEVPIMPDKAEATTNKPIGPAITKSIKPDAVQGSPDPAAALKKHIQKNIRYPQSARDGKITGYVLVDLKVAGNKLVKVSVAKSLQSDIDNEVLRAFSLYKDTINLKDDNYSLAIFYQIPGIEYKNDLFTTTDKYNFLGYISVIAMAGTNQLIPGSASTNAKIGTVDILPEFIGGMVGWSTYLSGNLKYPEMAKKKRVEGRVLTGFTVEKDGKLSDIKILQGLGSGLDEEAVRVLKNSPSWKPGIQDGRPVRVAYTMPIYFKLGSNPIDQKP